MPRFVILEHDHPYPHFDLMLESGNTLWTWRLPRLPQLGDALDAERLADHRLDYLDYEGPVSGNRGIVWRREFGDLNWLTVEEGRLEARVHGVQLQGLLRLTRQNGSERWRLQCGD
jgi:hypothetical protein